MESEGERASVREDWLQQMYQGVCSSDFLDLLVSTSPNFFLYLTLFPALPLLKTSYSYFLKLPNSFFSHG